MTESKEWEKFLQIITQVEKQREFDRKIDRLKKSSSATTFWAVFGGIMGLHGLAHFYLNRPLEGFIIFISGFIPSLLIFSAYTFQLSYLGFYPVGQYSGLGMSSNAVLDMMSILVIIRIGFFVGNVISARYHYSRYDLYIHWKAKKPWNNWGLNSQL